MSEKNFVCTNNALDARLTSGKMRLGRPSECHRRGVGAGLYTKLAPDEVGEFLAKWTTPYKKLIEQPLYYGDAKKAPPGKIHATLSQCVARGFAVGAKKRAEQILNERRRSHSGFTP